MGVVAIQGIVFDTKLYMIPVALDKTRHITDPESGNGFQGVLGPLIQKNALRLGILLSVDRLLGKYNTAIGIARTDPVERNCIWLFRICFISPE